MIAGVAEIFQRRELLGALVERSLRVRTKRSTFGIAWPLVAPFLLLALYTFVFRGVFDVPIDHYPEFLFAGLLPWSFLATTLPASMTALSTDPGLVRRAAFPLALLPISHVVAMSLYFVTTLTVFVAYLGGTGQLNWAVLPLLLGPTVALMLIVSSLSLVFTVIDVYNHDLRYLIGNILTIWFFLVPIVYRQNMAPRQVTFLRSVDPMNMVVGQFRDLLYFGQVSRPGHMALMLGAAVSAFLVALAVFRRIARDVVRDV